MSGRTPPLVVEKSCTIASPSQCLAGRRHGKLPLPRNDQQRSIGVAAALQLKGEAAGILARVERHADRRLQAESERKGVVHHPPGAEPPSLLTPDMGRIDRRQAAARPDPPPG